MIHLGGELWSARTVIGAERISEGERVEVIELEGLRVVVRPVEGDVS